MAKYIIVAHAWHVTSKGFIVEEVEAESEVEAIGIAHNITGRFDSFYNKAFKVVQVKEDESIARRSLTFKERITGIANL